jgi:hypothetical protein
MRVFSRLEDCFATGKFHSGGRSQLRLLRADTSVVRLSSKLINRSDGTSTDPFVTVPHYLEHCWRRNEICHLWFQHHLIDWPAHFDRPLHVERAVPKASQLALCRPPDSGLYLLEYERRPDVNELLGDFIRTVSTTSV